MILRVSKGLLTTALVLCASSALSAGELACRAEFAQLTNQPTRAQILETRGATISEQVEFFQSLLNRAYMNDYEFAAALSQSLEFFDRGELLRELCRASWSFDTKAQTIFVQATGYTIAWANRDYEMPDEDVLLRFLVEEVAPRSKQFGYEHLQTALLQALYHTSRGPHVSQDFVEPVADILLGNLSKSKTRSKAFRALKNFGSQMDYKTFERLLVLSEGGKQTDSEKEGPLRFALRHTLNLSLQAGAVALGVPVAPLVGAPPPEQVLILRLYKERSENIDLFENLLREVQRLDQDPHVRRYARKILRRIEKSKKATENHERHRRLHNNSDLGLYWPPFS